MRAHPKASIPTLRPSSTQEPASSSAGRLTPILQQNRTQLSMLAGRLPRPIPKPKAPQKSLLDTAVPSREMRSSPIHQNTDTSRPNQETSTRHWSSPTHGEQTPRLRETMTLQPAERLVSHPTNFRYHLQNPLLKDTCSNHPVKNPFFLPPISYLFL